MARTISHALLLTGVLVAETPLHVGGADSGHESDLPLAVDGKGRFYLPGSSLAGAIRAWERASDGNSIWGYAQGDQGAASYMLVDDAPALDAPLAELWHGIGIDRRHGGAARRAKFDRQVLPRGMRFDFRLIRELALDSGLELAQAQMGRIVLALEVGEIAFGAGSTRGYGRLVLHSARASETRWNTRSGMLDWLNGESTDALAAWRAEAGKDAGRQSRAGEPPVDHLRITIEWRPRGPLMSKAARDGLAVDSLPFVSQTGSGLALTLPGSGIKGALRSHAERIVRTVLCDDLNAAAEQHFDQVAVDLVGELFGSARPGDAAVTGDNQPPGVRALLSVDTCYACEALDAGELAGFDQPRENWRDSQRLARADHVAIDRWTGGAAESLLYSGVEPRPQAWQPIRLRFRGGQGGQASNTAALALLWLTLRDFCAGRIALGFGANRGYGDLAVSRLTIDWAEGDEQQVLPVKEGVIDETNIAEWVKKMKHAWQEWQKAREGTR